MVHRVDRVGAAPNISDLQAFKNVSLQMMIYQTFTFRQIFFFFNFHHIQVLTFDTKGQSGNGTLLPLPTFASTKICSFRFDITA